MYSSHSVQLDAASSVAEGKVKPLYPETVGNITLMQLVFVALSPNFCDTNLAIGVPGVCGRLCTTDPDRPNSCDTLCCGRGSTAHTYTVPVEECKFIWCCRIECKIVSYKTVTEHTCNC